MEDYYFVFRDNNVEIHHDDCDLDDSMVYFWNVVKEEPKSFKFVLIATENHETRHLQAIVRKGK